MTDNESPPLTEREWKPETTWSAAEYDAISVLAKEQGLTRQQLLRQCLRLYQLHCHRHKAGETCRWSGDEQRAREFAAGISCEPQDNIVQALSPPPVPPPGQQATPCPACNGDGRIQEGTGHANSEGGEDWREVPCYACHGAGVVHGLGGYAAWTEPCPICQPKFYLQCENRGYIGNAPVFWGKTGNGYTQWLDEAALLTEAEANSIIDSCRSHRFRKWPQAQVEGVAQRTVDIQKLRKEPANV